MMSLAGKQPQINARIALIAKAPVAGFAKTRLIPALGEQGSAKIAKRLLEHATSQAVAAELGNTYLFASPFPLSKWPDVCIPDSLRVFPQADGDLGNRLIQACLTMNDDEGGTNSFAQQELASEQTVELDSPIILMGTDCPSLTVQVLRQCAAELNQVDACLIPASDGGYVALGLKRLHRSIFTDIAWSTEVVCSTTEQRFDALGWSYSKLPTMHDIDEQQDLQWLPPEWLAELDQ